MRPYIDCHNHIGRTIDRVPPVGQNTAMCLARYAETSIYAGISAPTAVGNPIVRGIEDIRHQNAVITRACHDFPDRFPIGMAVIEARFGRLGIEEVEHAMREPGLVGIIGHLPMGEWCIPFVEVAAARGGLCNLHIHNQLMGDIARMFPTATFIVHASTYAVEHFAGLENVWFEVVQTPDGPGTTWDLNALVNRVNRERLIFGSGLPNYDYRILQRVIEKAEIDDNLKDRIAYKNIIALIQQYQPGWTMPDGPVVAPRRYDPAELWAANPNNPARLAAYA